MTSKEREALCELILTCIQGQAGPEQIADLESRLAEDPEALRYYRHFLILYSGLRKSPARLLSSRPWGGEEEAGMIRPGSQEIKPLPKPGSSSEQKTREIENYAQEKLNAFLAEEEAQRQRERQLQRSARREWDLKPIVRSLGRGLLFAKRLAVGVAAILVVLVSVNYIQSLRIVATLGPSMHAQWEPALDSNELRPGWLHLERGYAHLTLKKGADVLLQAPCAIKLQTDNQLHLESGSLCATVPPEAHGFTVETPQSKIVDFGTEFGTRVGDANQIEVHVFQGDVGVGALAAAQPSHLKAVTMGEAALWSGQNDVEVQALDRRSRLFARSLPEPNRVGVPGFRIDLADVIGNGNGFGSGHLGHAINLNTGQCEPAQETKGRGISNCYVPVPDIPFIDGVFIPDGEKTGRIEVSSTGLVFTHCPNTNGNFPNSLVNGARFGWRSSEFEFEGEEHFGQLGGQIYGSKQFPAIGMHANVGVTFNLSELREQFYDSDALVFKAFCGISETAAPYIMSGQEPLKGPVTVDFWVLVDGVQKFHQTLSAVPAEMVVVEVVIPEYARYLTLMTTDAKGSTKFCWGMFAQPVLELARP